jgi:sugar phosphate permease
LVAPTTVEAPPRRWTQRMFGASWLSYFSYYFTRKNLSVSKKAVQAELGLDKAQLRDIDTAYLSAYAIGQVANGFLADRLGPRRMVSIGMIASSIAAIAFAYTDRVIGVVMAAYFLSSAVNGLVQSTGWPGNGKLMASWFSTRRRGEVMGWWSTCYQAGGLCATWAASWLLGFGWRAAFVGPAIYVAAVGVAYALTVRDRPSDVGFADPEIPPGTTREELARLRRAATGQVLRSPLAWSLGAAYFALKMMRYGFLFWLPYYLNAALSYGDQKAGYVSTAFEAGGIPLVILSGILADRAFGRRRIAVAAASMVMLVGALALYREIGEIGVVANVVGLVLVGAFLFSADALVSGAAAQDVGGPHAAALACGLINGVGSIGAVVQGYVVVYVSDEYGWGALFTVFEVMAALGALALLPFIRVRPRAD